MKFYLRVINPALSILVLLICTWASIFYDSGIDIFGIVGGSFSSYFFAKGIYTSGSLFLFGRILLDLLYKNESTSKKESKYDLVATGAFLSFTISSLIGLFLWANNINQIDNEGVSFSNPTDLSVLKSYQVPEVNRLRIGGTIKNHSMSNWSNVKVKAKLYIADRYTGSQTTSIDVIQSNEQNDFVIDFHEVVLSKVNDSVSWKFELEGVQR
ncbi:hypothetical protein CHISP_3336 [Chitinispirillum alkaliphilum]|nr:hypothetical protein CHISP_3336 [Chitinispirillum alkaliphilum]